jgi:hypothetical protein
MISIDILLKSKFAQKLNKSAKCNLKVRTFVKVHVKNVRTPIPIINLLKNKSIFEVFKEQLKFNNNKNIIL